MHGAFGVKFHTYRSVMTLSIKNISKTYEHRLILDDISFEVNRGEIFGIFGVTSSGKSTLIRALAGAIRSDRGLIFFDDRDVSLEENSERGFYFSNLTNGSFWRRVFKTEEPSELADGEGQGLALDEAIRKAESVLLLDNQFCFMDREQREQKVSSLKKTVREKGLAVVFATNDFEEVFTICDRVAILHEGRILQIGTPREVYEHPVSLTVAVVTGRNNVIRARRMTSRKADAPHYSTVDGEHILYTSKPEKSDLAPINQDAFLTIRPEYISISFGASFPEDNLLKAKVSEISYLGATTLIKLDADGLQLSALVLRLVGLNLGDECMVGLPPDRIHVMKQ